MHFSERYATAHRSRTVRIKKRTIIFLIFVITLFFGLMGSLWMSWWRVKTITIDGLVDHEEASRVVTAVIRQRKALVLPEDNYLFIPKQKIIDAFADQMIGVALVEQKFPDQLRITFPQWKPAMIICIDSQCFYATNEGMIFTKAPNTSESSLPKLILTQKGDASDEHIRLGATIVSSEDTDFLSSLIGALHSRAAALSRIESVLPSASMPLRHTEYTMYLKEGWRLIVDTSRDKNETVGDLLQLLDQKIKSREKLGYIDLRFADKAFFKYGSPISETMVHQAPESTEIAPTTPAIPAPSASSTAIVENH